MLNLKLIVHAVVIINRKYLILYEYNYFEGTLNFGECVYMDACNLIKHNSTNNNSF